MGTWVPDRSQPSALTLHVLWCPFIGMLLGSACEVMSLRKYSQMRLCSRAGLFLVLKDPQEMPPVRLGTQANAGSFWESQMLGRGMSV